MTSAAHHEHSFESDTDRRPLVSEAAMSPVLHTPTTGLLGLALDAASLRQQVHGLNVARAGQPGQPLLQVSFEAQLERARRSLARDGNVSTDSLAGVSPQVETMPVANAQTGATQLDTETLKLAENAVHFQALLRGLSRHLGVLAQAVGDGRR